MSRGFIKIYFRNDLQSRSYNADEGGKDKII